MNVDERKTLEPHTMIRVIRKLWPAYANANLRLRIPCADPESFARGGPALIFFVCFVFEFFYERI